MATEIVGSEQGYWEQKVSDFKEKAQEFMRGFEALLSMREAASSDPTLKNEWEGLVKRGESIKSKIEYVTNKIDAAVKWLKTSFDGFDLQEYKEQTLGVLPLLSLVPIALIAGAIALMTKWLSDVYIFNKKLSEIQRLQRAGVPAAEAAELVRATEAPPIFGDLTPLFRWIVIGGVIYLGWKMFYKKGV